MVGQNVLLLCPHHSTPLFGYKNGGTVPLFGQNISDWRGSTTIASTIALVNHCINHCINYCMNHCIATEKLPNHCLYHWKSIILWKCLDIFSLHTYSRPRDSSSGQELSTFFLKVRFFGWGPNSVELEPQARKFLRKLDDLIHVLR